MAKLSAYHKISGLLVAMLMLSLIAGAQYTLRYQPVDRDSSFITDTLKLQRTFQNLPNCMSYVKKIPALLQKKGYPNASVDSTRYDSLNAICVVYVGDGVKYSVLNTDSIDQSILAHAGISKRNPPDILDLKKVQERILNHLENTGYPFASVAVDSLKFTED